MVERATHNRQVTGSNPVGAILLPPDLRLVLELRSPHFGSLSDEGIEPGQPFRRRSRAELR